jgi:uncharacterized protein (DUF2147 family)
MPPFAKPEQTCVIRPFLAATLLIAAVPGSAATPITGHWMTAGKDSIVEISDCGQRLCGKVSKLINPKPGRPTVDANNPNPKLRTRPIVGLAILSDFIDSGSEWDGTIYDPRSGKSYKSKVARNADGTLKVQGCIAFFCQTQTWTSAK